VNQLDFNNFLPLFETPIWQLLKISNTVAAFTFGETVTFLMVLPFLNQTNEGRSKTIIGILWAALFILLASWRSIGALGATGNIFSYPAFEAVKLINLPFVSMRLEIIIVINFLMMGFLKITALHYSTVLGLGQIFKLRSIRPLIVPIGILMVIFSIINYSGFIENVEFTYQVYHIYALPFQLGMPLLTLIVAVIRKLPQRSTE
jgi:spore germination protein KB